MERLTHEWHPSHSSTRRRRTSSPSNRHPLTRHLTPPWDAPDHLRSAEHPERARTADSLTDHKRGTTPNRASNLQLRQATPNRHHDRLALLNTQHPMRQPTAFMHHDCPKLLTPYDCANHAEILLRQYRGSCFLNASTSALHNRAS